jgi:TetR/AcrR family transcriptional repressor of mexJK operon
MTSSSNPGLSRVVTDAGRTERKHTQIVDSARTLFLESGFDTTSVDAIARHAGVSKATLYAHFTDKDALLLALVEEDCERRRDPLWMPHDRTIDLERDLREIGQRFLSIFLDDQALAMHRLIMSCAARRKAATSASHRSGPARMKASAIAG